jgi:hypothetical protein
MGGTAWSPNAITRRPTVNRLCCFCVYRCEGNVPCTKVGGCWWFIIITFVQGSLFSSDRCTAIRKVVTWMVYIIRRIQPVV